MRAAVALAWGEVEARCPACRREPALRERWGCDAPAAAAVFSITCPDCGGIDPECPPSPLGCGGSGSKDLHRCPASFLTLDVTAALEAYRQFDARGVLPACGAWLDQSAAFCSLVAAVDAERGAIEEGRARHQRRMAGFTRPKGAE